MKADTPDKDYTTLKKRPARIAGFDDFVAGPANRERLVKVAERIVNRDEAEDAAHDGIVQALSSASGFRQEAQLSTWMHQVVVNAALMRVRRRVRGQKHVERARHQIDVTPWLAGAQASPAAAALLEQAQLVARVRQAVSELGETYRSAVERCLLDENDPESVAKELGLSTSALRTRLGRGRRHLAHAMAGDHDAI